MSQVQGRLNPEVEAQAAKELLILAYWYHAGLPAHTPAWVLKHPMWPGNNDKFHPNSTKGQLATASPGRDRLWEAIAASFGLRLNNR